MLLKFFTRTPLAETWSPYTDHNPIEVRLAKGWVFRAVCRPVRKLRRPNWRLLRGSGEAAQTARAALSAELDRRVAESEPTSWSEVVDLGLGVARVVLGDEPCRDSRPWVRGLEGDLQGFDRAVSQASSRKRKAESADEFRAASYAVRRCKRRRSAWLREREVSWWDAQAQLVQDKADQGDAFGVFATFKELRNRGATVHLGDVKPADVEAERAAWAEHFRLIGEGEGLVSDRVWDNIPSCSPMDAVCGHP